jgi:type II secretion system protein G
MDPMESIGTRIALLLAISSISCLGQQKPRIQRVHVDLTSIHSALVTYKLFTGAFPVTDQGLAALSEKPRKPPIPKRWVQIAKEVPKDPWGREYQYRNQDGQIELWSKGAAEDDPDDDIVFEATEARE